MGFFSPFEFKTKKGTKYWLHMKDRGKTRIYYFSKDQVGAMMSIPPGYESFESERTGMPMLRKKTAVAKQPKEQKEQS